jgi:hypothetical protein
MRCHHTAYCKYWRRAAILVTLSLSCHIYNIWHTLLHLWDWFATSVGLVCNICSIGFLGVLNQLVGVEEGF